MLRKIEINAVLNGFIVQVGCTAVVFESAPKMLEELGKYLADPVATEKAYQTASINADKMGQIPQPVERTSVRGSALESNLARLERLRDRHVGESLGDIAAGAGAMLGQAVAEGAFAHLRTTHEAVQAMTEDPGDACVGQNPVGDR